VSVRLILLFKALSNLFSASYEELPRVLFSSSAAEGAEVDLFRPLFPQHVSAAGWAFAEGFVEEVTTVA